jgi:long-chain acyl-CoA synthetase
MGNLITMVQKSALRYGSREVFRFRKYNDTHYSNLSWNDLVAEYQNVSRALISLGFGYGDNIGIFSENRVEWVITDLGIISNRSVVDPFMRLHLNSSLNTLLMRQR